MLPVITTTDHTEVDPNAIHVFGDLGKYFLGDELLVEESYFLF